MAIICKENREGRAEARSSDLTLQIAASCLSALMSGAFPRLLRSKGLKMLAFPAPSLLALTKNHLDHFVKINRSRPQSSLEAVGFLAAITTMLASAGMGVNPVSAFFHDHLFLSIDHIDKAKSLLEELAIENAQ
jgi:hypothetical protein